jgi:hypothetical protein
MPHPVILKSHQSQDLTADKSCNHGTNFSRGLLLEAIGLFAAVLPVFLSIGLVLAPIGYFVGFEWAIWIDAARSVARQKLKMNVLLLVSAVVVAVLRAIFPGL